MSASPSTAVPSLRGNHVYLRAVVPADLPALRAAEASGDLAARWRYRGATPGPDGAQAGDALIQMLVVRASDDARVGVVALYGVDLRDGHGMLAAARLEEAARSPLMMLGLALFLRYVFACWDLRKLYMELPEYNLEQFASGLGRFFEIEGRLRDHYFYGGELWDQVILAIHRDAWLARPHPVLDAETGG